MKKIIYILVLILVTGRSEAQRLTFIDALQLNEELDYRTKRPSKIVETNISYSIIMKEIRDKIIKIFDKAGLLSTFEFYGDNDSLIARVSYSNDTLNRLKLSRVYEVWGRNGLMKETSTYSYDSRNFLTGNLDLDRNGNFIRKTTIICNEKGNPIEVSLLDINNKLIAKETATYFYSRNKVFRSVVMSDIPVINNKDSLKISIKYESKYPSDYEVYNNYGDKIKWKENSDIDRKMYYEREFNYDNYGNWIDSKIYLVRFRKNGELYKELKSIINREITYL
jgi:hypothetical protein